MFVTKMKIITIRFTRMIISKLKKKWKQNAVKIYASWMNKYTNYLRQYELKWDLTPNKKTGI